MANIVTVTDSGLITATENEIYQEIIEKCLELDPEFNTDPSTFDGYINAWHAENYHVIIESLREAWNSKDTAGEYCTIEPTVSVKFYQVIN